MPKDVFHSSQVEFWVLTPLSVYPYIFYFSYYYIIVSISFSGDWTSFVQSPCPVSLSQHTQRNTHTHTHRHGHKCTHSCAHTKMHMLCTYTPYTYPTLSMTYIAHVKFKWVVQNWNYLIGENQRYPPMIKTEYICLYRLKNYLFIIFFIWTS